MTFDGAANTRELSVENDVLTFDLTDGTYSMDEARLAELPGMSSDLTIENGTMNVANTFTIGDGGTGSLPCTAGAQVIAGTLTAGASERRPDGTLVGQDIARDTVA